VYPTTISTSLWPATAYVDVMSIHPIHSDKYNYTRLVQLFIDHSIVNKDNYIEKNLVELHVYVESNATQFIEEQVSYNISHLTSDLGGILGLRESVVDSSHLHSQPAHSHRPGD
jgi:hypothetical protein